MAETAFARFDGAECWAALPAAHRDQIGAIALELFAAWHVQERCFEDGLPARFQRLGDAADAELIDRLAAACVLAVERELLEAPDGTPRIPALPGPACRACGCTQSDPCRTPEGPCGWAEPDLCTACAGGGHEAGRDGGRAAEEASPASIAAEMAEAFRDFDRSLDRLDAAAGEIAFGISRAHPEGLA